MRDQQDAINDYWDRIADDAAIERYFDMLEERRRATFTGAGWLAAVMSLGHPSYHTSSL